MSGDFFCGQRRASPASGKRCGIRMACFHYLRILKQTPMISNARIKYLKSLQQKKVRQECGLFVAETPKVAEVFLSSDLHIRQIIAVQEWWDEKKNRKRWESYENRSGQTVEKTVATDKELERISGLNTPHQIWMSVERPSTRDESPDSLYKGCSLVLDDIRDPGNLGTIIRICDWFAIDRIICTDGCADAFQPKCVQASMGSVAGVPIVYLPAGEILKLIVEKPGCNKVYGTFPEGENLYTQKLADENTWYLIGNEAHGIRPELCRAVDSKISIPAFPKAGLAGAESLNAAMAAAILCSEVRGGKFREQLFGCKHFSKPK